jgi:hypothetical protein
VSDGAPATAFDICRPEVVMTGSRQCHAEPKTPRR